MRLKYLTDKAYETLSDNIEIDKEKYYSAAIWVPEYFKGKEYFKESRIETAAVKLFMEGDRNESDIVNVKLVFDAFEKLTPQQASNEYLWSYLSLVEFWEYSFWRWGKEIEREAPEDNESNDTTAQSLEPKRAVNIKQRYLCQKNRAHGFLRNSISRLWWFGYLTYKDGSRSQKYELTELLLSQSDLCQSIMERNFSMNRNVCFGILSAIKKINDDEGLSNVIMAEWRSLCKYINRYGAVTLLDTLLEEDVEELSYKYILNLRI